METLNLIYFSPTKTTQKIVREIGHNFNSKEKKEYNLTLHKNTQETEIGHNTLTIIGMPTYAGRLPVTGLERIKKLKANNSPAIIVVVYGNRAYEDALIELKEVTENCGFKIIGAASFIGEHSFSTKERPIAPGRPDQSDFEKAREFSRKMLFKISHADSSNGYASPEIPGHYPYKQRTPSPFIISPETDEKLCDLCGICASVCPTQAITINNSVVTNKDQCIWCCACVKACPTQARFFDSEPIDGVREKLYANCSQRREPEFFL